MIDARFAAQKKCASHVWIIILSRAGSRSGLFGGSAWKPFCRSLILKLHTSFPRAATGIEATTWSSKQKKTAIRPKILLF